MLHGNRDGAIYQIFRNQQFSRILSMPPVHFGLSPALDIALTIFILTFFFQIFQIKPKHNTKENYIKMKIFPHQKELRLFLRRGKL